MELVRYDAACRAIAEAKSIDEVKEITNRAEAGRAYARQAKNKALELNCLEIRTRAERRLGEIILSYKDEQLIRVGGPGWGRKDERPPITLKELGIDSSLSAAAQRLAKLPEGRFISEIAEWRAKAETAQRVEVPLQRYRIPTIEGDRQRAAARLGRTKVDVADPLDRFRAMDGRRVGDWRYGELDRLDELAARVRVCVAVLRDAIPFASVDPLDTMEMIFRSPEALVSILQPIWDQPITSPKTGIQPSEKVVHRRTCAQCGCDFSLPRSPHKDRPNEGKFCSRACQSRSLHERARKAQVGKRR